MHQGLITKIENTDGKWLINGKQYNKCTQLEQKYFDNFLRHNNQLIRHVSYVKNHIN